MTDIVRQALPWRDPLEVAATLSDRDGLLALLSDGGDLGRWSWIACDPEQSTTGGLGVLDELLDADARGAVALVAYDAGARPATGERPRIWPDVMGARYRALLAFDHWTRSAVAMGIGADGASAARHAEQWLAAPAVSRSTAPPSASLKPEATEGAYREAVSAVVRRIGAGELFQANIARGWSGVLGEAHQPFDVLMRLADRRSAYGAYWRLGDRAVVSNSPELFLAFDPLTRRLESRPIKGTRPRLSDPVSDAAQAEALAASDKDRAENLMIVDLMRNDLSRVCETGSVKVERLFNVERHPTVHHLVSTVTGRARDGATPAKILQATFPPGSITGAPKHQAMKVIAEHEPPRGAWCGSLVWVDPDGGMTASVLIRTALFDRRAGRWTYRVLAGAGIVADSDPDLELAETDAKIRALREALTGA